MAKAVTKRKPKAKPKFTDKEQSERFITTARELGVEETGDGFTEAFTKVASAKRK